MNKLNDYQRVAQWTKKVGGVRNLGGLIFGAGLLSGVVISSAFFYVCDKNKEEDAKKESYRKNNTFEVTNSGVDDSGLTFELGDEFTVLSKKDNSVSIIMNDDDNNQVYVSDDFLKSVSGAYSLY